MSLAAKASNAANAHFLSFRFIWVYIAVGSSGETPNFDWLR